ncbi:PREDICTED: hybrid signal transduction protein dokA isoform X2 [Nelumbo nucifera]|uniref:Hybrid signal transduction protein dokA isoform X2 n=1 Tax=Nelumbo nucifera TaxID=4432 RepID=A0A1U7ZVT9_NELNU|nr:PREDICTED: hybrid signal transduction protein dokA isoform X2 [Nelumbo nucifera]
MEGVGARLGRSSTRYGPATVFSGPVRKWKKKWVHVSSSSATNHTPQPNGTNGNNGSHLLLYKWTPITRSNNNNNGDKNSAKDDNTAAVAPPEEPPKRKFRYVPIAVLEEQKMEADEKTDEETKPSDADPSGGGTPRSDSSNGKPDINDVPMEENQASEKDHLAPQDLSETSLDLSLGLKAHDGDRDPNSKTEDQGKEGQQERMGSGGGGA